MVSVEFLFWCQEEIAGKAMPSAWIKVKIWDFKKLKYSWGHTDWDAVFFSCVHFALSHCLTSDHPASSDWQMVFSVQGFTGGLMVKSPPCNSGDTGPIPGPGRSHMPHSN